MPARPASPRSPPSTREGHLTALTASFLPFERRTELLTDVVAPGFTAGQ